MIDNYERWTNEEEIRVKHLPPFSFFWLQVDVFCEFFIILWVGYFVSPLLIMHSIVSRSFSFVAPFTFTVMGIGSVY